MAIAYYFLIRKVNKVAGINLLIIGSLFFYTWWKVEYLALLMSSIVLNYVAGQAIMKYKGISKPILVFGIVLNLATLGYYKYSGFFLGMFDYEHLVGSIVLPLAISFFTFQQIAYLVDAKQNKIEDNSFRSYVLFVAFFPQLVSGPIVHHKDVLQQFSKDYRILLDSKTIAAAITIIAIGLFKKVVIADSLAPHANWVFELGNQGAVIPAVLAWSGSLCYTLQIYFDFSGYSDIAIGSALLFGIQLPINFNSPYKSASIIDFWRRWHITLSTFLKDYLYIPMGGNRHGEFNRHLFLMITMLLGGLWHGAGWIYVIWGGMHGFALVINHLYRKKIAIHFTDQFRGGQTYHLTNWLITFIFVNLTFIVFRSESLLSITTLTTGLFEFTTGMTDAMVDKGVFILGTSPLVSLVLIGLLCLVVKALPNTQQILDYKPRENFSEQAKWQPGIVFAVTTGIILIISLYKIIGNGYSEFIYRFF
ncbi:MBOAT family O-acyltransferase [Marinicella litoralis]|nr:MBOAT family O-acyltransferase [Marinicella litoralis]